MDHDDKAWWPTLTPWADTRDTLHLWTQIVGKVRLASEPMINHWGGRCRCTSRRAG
jgi:Family of unknown function (DUF5996)